jgi:hypothetical protein
MTEITLLDLVHHRACTGERDKFRRLFGEKLVLPLDENEINVLALKLAENFRESGMWWVADHFDIAELLLINDSEFYLENTRNLEEYHQAITAPCPYKDEDDPLTIYQRKYILTCRKQNQRHWAIVLKALIQ